MIYKLIGLFSLSLFSGFSLLEHSDPIVVRHDLEDTVFTELAKQFEPYLCHLNLPDCEGTIIADQWAISAAHCAIEIQKKLAKGQKHNVIMNGQEVEVKEVIIHKQWPKKQAMDIALIRFHAKPAGSKIAKLYRQTDELNKIVYCVGKGDKGTGKTGIDGNDGKLRAATNKIDMVRDNWLAWTFDDPGKESESLTEYEGISGPGDSGGPAIILQDNEVYVAGISSGQDTRATDGVEGIYGVTEYYARVSRHISWIEKRINVSE